jgi:hypothetical protein
MASSGRTIGSSPTTSPSATSQLRRAIGPRHPGPIVFLAGRLYRESLLDFAGDRAAIPMAGMGIGQQKAWLAAQIASARKRAARAAQLDFPPDS